MDDFIPRHRLLDSIALLDKCKCDLCQSEKRKREAKLYGNAPVEQYSKMIFLSKEAQENWDNASPAVKRDVIKIMDENLKETQRKIMDDMEYLNYNLDSLQKIFEEHHEEFVRKLEKSREDHKKAWPEDEYNPNTFSLPMALLTLIREVKRMRCSMETVPNDTKFWRDKSGEYEWLYQEQKHIAEGYRKIIDELQVKVHQLTSENTKLNWATKGSNGML